MNKFLLFMGAMFCTTLTAQTISNVTVTPSPASPGGDISITLTYNTDDANDLIYYALELKNTDSGSWVKNSCRW